MIWSKGYTAQCYVKTVDVATWRDVDRIEIYGGSVTRSDGTLIESATLDCTAYDDTAERWVRVWMDTSQNGSSEHTPVFTGLATSPGRDVNGFLITNTVECYSVLKPAQDVLLARGWYAPAGADGAELVRQLLSVTPAPTVVEDASPILTAAYIAEDGESCLTMAHKILQAMNWHIRITGDGVIHIEPKPTEAAVTFDVVENDVIEPKLHLNYDWFSCPNVFRAVQGDASAVAVDDSPDSIFSTVSRGREVWKEEKGVKLNENESLQSYAERRLREEQIVAFEASYDRRFRPDITIDDVIYLHYPAQGMDGNFRVTSQDIDLKTGRTSEGAVLI